MIESKFFRKLIFISILGVITFMLIGLLSSFLINNLFEKNELRAIAPKEKLSLIKVSLLNIPNDQRESFVENLNSMDQEFFRLISAEDKGSCKESNCHTYPIDKVHSLKIYPKKPSFLEKKIGIAPKYRKGPPGPKRFKGDRDGHRPPRRPRFEGRRGDHRPPPPRGPGKGPTSSRLLMTTGIQLVVMIFYISIFVFLIYFYSKKRREAGEDVFKRIKAGDLDARFSVSKVDDFGTNTKLFNEMADEIMNLVLMLREKDNNRKLLFKTLAHDLKTPAASLKGIMETLSMRREELTEPQRNELYKMSIMEIDYFAALLDDILFLAKVQDPEFKYNGVEIEAVMALSNLCDSIGFINKKRKLTFDSDAEKVFIKMDQNSFMRLFRNALDNAFKYGSSRVDVKVRDDKGLLVTIFNDGDGFSHNALKDFGVMKTSHSRTHMEGVMSFGIGSVIMVAIVESVDGRITPSNTYSEDGTVIGSQIEIFLPSTGNV